MAKRRQNPKRRLVRIELADFEEVASGAHSTTDREAVVDATKACSRDDLNGLWLRHFSGEPPRGLPLELVRKIVSWRLRHGARAFDRSTRRRLAQLVHHYTTNSPLDGEYRPHLDSGDVLKREWRGTVHRVAVDSHGYTYDGVLFGSLSEVARKITGTRWSGPRFFGLERKLVSSPRGSGSHV